MPRTIRRAPFIQAPRRQLASKAARKLAPSTGGVIYPFRAARKSAPSTGPSIYDPERAEWERAERAGLAERGCPSTPSSSVIDLTESPPTSNIPPSHEVTTSAASLVGEELKRAIATVSEQHLRSAILKVCTESVETAQLLGPLLTPSALGTSEKKRKWSPQICEHCEEEIDDDGDGCCKWRRMDIARREAEEEELEGLKDYLGSSGENCENCGEDIDDEDDGCCKFRRMQVAKMEDLQDRRGNYF
ncbi:hypothetical protein DL98DRAFT_512522 [Cadophora sp. DSE1049]|nr:hypothetical protein DL98DRAFT_512522 [Cadophora sp. DSE1049]